MKGHLPSRGRVSTRVIIVIVGAIVLALGISAYWFLLKPGPEQVVQRYLMAEALGDYRTMRTLLVSKVARQLPPDEDLPPPPKEPKIPEMDIGQARVEGNRAIVAVRTKGPAIPGLTYGRLEQTTNVVLVKEGGQWKVDPIATAEASRGGTSGLALPEEPPGGP
jgi:hypothetical protein